MANNLTAPEIGTGQLKLPTLQFKPKTDDELSTDDWSCPLAPGKYPFTVHKAAIVPSKSAKNPGRPMVRIDLCVHGRKFDKYIYDYFADWFSEQKLKHFLECIGHSDWYQSGSFDPSACSGFQGMVKVGIDSKDGTKNIVVDYLPGPEQKVGATAPEAPMPSAADDDIPF